ncbi:hypothetical protein TanjilG_27596 [Lupinus angustifolius]|uniref:Uncharacterized protein n=1 Tax=Lupinus angustifolius TaxID=3871 RepID=A0A4P1R383_LUPAN|nr:hypothetical protein TanjilG_27596 [Lupinus angustifolius]
MMMARTTLDFSSTFQRHDPTAIIIPSPFSFTLLHKHHHYPFNAPTTSYYSFITNIIIHQLFSHNHLHLHHKNHFSHRTQAQEEDEDNKDKEGKDAGFLVLMRKP